MTDLSIGNRPLQSAMRWPVGVMVYHPVGLGEHRERSAVQTQRVVLFGLLAMWNARQNRALPREHARCNDDDTTNKQPNRWFHSGQKSWCLTSQSRQRLPAQSGQKDRLDQARCGAATHSPPGHLPGSVSIGHRMSSLLQFRTHNN
eukprot:485791-Rhodomonas_salina.1